MKEEGRKTNYRLVFFRLLLVAVPLVIIIFLTIFLFFSPKQDESEPRSEIVLDETSPELTLFGEEEITILTGEEFSEPGFSAVDDGKDLTDRVEVINKVKNDKPGKYLIIYRVADQAGNKSLKKRKIIVEENYNFETNDEAFFIRSLKNYLEKKQYKLSIGYYNFEKDYTFLYNEKKEYYGASLVKPVASLYAYENLSLNKNDKDAIERMISVSDNDAYIEIADKIGIKNLKTYGENLGLTNFMTDKSNVYYSDTTVENQLIIWKKIWDYINTSEKGAELKSYFENNNTNYINFNNTLKTIHKYGAWEEYFHDTGIVLGESPYIVIILTKEGGANYSNIIRDLSEKIYRFNEIIKNK